ncbi:MAG: alpha/beta fold hydrolase [Alphaproteobacteria bacterium]|nr:alpha/beta fold hydrolase [Alphaproteobacteria bacterium]
MQITANGIQLEYEEYGAKDAPVIILIRGLGTQLVHWPRLFIDGLVALGLRTIVFDNRDAGLSQKFDGVGAAREIRAILKSGGQPEPAYSLDDMALDTVGLMDALSIKRAHVFGISMGGAITQLLAINHADRLLSATMVMTAAHLGGAGLLEYLLLPPQTCEQAQENWVQGHRDWGSPGFPISEEALRAEAALAWERYPDADGSNRQAIATLAAPDRREALKNVALDCMVIHGAVDTLIPVDKGRKIAALIPNARLHLIEGMGHVITPLLSPIIVQMVGDFIGSRRTSD